MKKRNAEIDKNTDLAAESEVMHVYNLGDDISSVIGDYRVHLDNHLLDFTDDEIKLLGEIEDELNDNFELLSKYYFEYDALYRRLAGKEHYSIDDNVKTYNTEIKMAEIKRAIDTNREYRNLIILLEINNRRNDR